MHELDEAFEAPSYIDVPIWRYLDLAKFLAMLETEALHFARANIMTDEFEGSTTRATAEMRRKALSSLKGSRETIQELDEMMAHAGEKYRDYTYLSCWHMSNHESAAMWAIYQSGEPRGIAVKSTYRRLSESITDERTVHIGTVAYMNFDAALMPYNNIFFPFLHKRRSFEYEREIRAIYPAPRYDKEAEGGWAAQGPPVVAIAVDLDRLVEAVYVSPKAPEWFAELIRNLLTRYGRDWTVHHSSLDNDPIF